MNDKLEDYILGQLLFYEQTRSLLPRIKADWFESPLHHKVVKRMQDYYFDNEPIDYMSLTDGYPKNERMAVISIGQNVSNVANVSDYLPRLEQKFLQKQFVEQLGKIDLTKSLKELL